LSGRKRKLGARQWIHAYTILKFYSMIGFCTDVAKGQL
jgi:hypothetical protein